MSNRLRIERLGDIAVFTISHVQRANALDDELLLALREALFETAAQGARAAVLTGAGGVFCAGYDLHALPKEPDLEWLRGHGELEATLKALRHGPLPVVAALSGPAIGAGFELALNCDVRVAHKDVILQMPPVKLGIVYTLSGIWRLMLLCGAGRARELLLLAEPIGAQKAFDMGLLSTITAPTELLDTAMAQARKIAAQPQAAIHGTRQLIEHLLQMGPDTTEQEMQHLLSIRQHAWLSPEAHTAREKLKNKPRS